MDPSSSRFSREYTTIRWMTLFYCRATHPREPAAAALCASCTEFLDYVRVRLEKCPFPAKPACSECPIHCYRPALRERAKTIMRFSGPKMLLRHPWLTLGHFWDKWRSASRIRAWKARQTPRT